MKFYKILLLLIGIFFSLNVVAALTSISAVNAVTSHICPEKNKFLAVILQAGCFGVILGSFLTCMLHKCNKQK